jgi:predicted membrane protein
MMQKKSFWGPIILLIGIILLLGNLNIIDYSVRRFFHDLWPAALIILGAYIIFRHFRESSNNSGINFNFHDDSIDGITGLESRAFGDFNIDLNGMDIDGLSRSVAFGDMTVNLSGVRLKSGINRASFKSSFGSLKVMVPAPIEFRAELSSSFGHAEVLGRSSGGLTDELACQTDGYDLAASKLYISAQSSFGEVKIIRV